MQTNIKSFMVVVVGILLFFGVLVNTRVLYVILTQSSKRRKRPGSVLIGHLSCVAICATVLATVQAADKLKIFQIEGTRVCEVLFALNRLVQALISANVFGIVYERFQTFSRFNRGKLLLARLICLIWGVSIIFAFPPALMVKTPQVHETGRITRKCIRVNLFESMIATIVYESFYLVVFHFLVVFYMIYAMCKLRASVTHLYLLKPIPDRKTLQKVQKIRFIYVHFIVFIMVWVPFGIVYMANSIIEKASDNLPSPSVTRIIVGFILFIYIVVNPVIYLWLMSPSKKSPANFSSSKTSASQSERKPQDKPNNFEQGTEEPQQQNKMQRQSSNAKSVCALSQPIASSSTACSYKHYKTTSV